MIDGIADVLASRTVFCFPLVHCEGMIGYMVDNAVGFVLGFIDMRAIQ